MRDEREWDEIGWNKGKGGSQARREAKRETRNARRDGGETWERSTMMFEDGERLKRKTQWSERGVQCSSGNVVGNSESDRSVAGVENRVLLPLSLSSIL